MNQLSLEEKIDRYRLYRTPRIGSINFRKLLNRFESAKKAIVFLEEQAIKQKKSAKILTIAKAKEEFSKADEKNITISVYGDDIYPDILKISLIASPVLYLLGHVHLLQNNCFSIVGSRNASYKALRYSFRMAEELGKNALTIVSGLAMGIDAEAHKGSLKTGTIAVLAGGVDVPYPSSNKKLYEEIKNCGLIVSEMEIGTAPTAKYFPIRNQIIASMSYGTLVVEAAFNSGSLITARIAADIGRDVYAIPSSPTDGRARGCNQLIRDGAILTETPEDVLLSLSCLNPTFIKNKEKEVRGSKNLFSSQVTINEKANRSDDTGSESLLKDLLDANDNENNEYKLNKEDFLEKNNEFENSIFNDNIERENISGTGQIILNKLAEEENSIDELIRKTDFDESLVQSTILELEILGVIKKTRDGKYYKIFDN